MHFGFDLLASVSSHGSGKAAHLEKWTAAMSYGLFLICAVVVHYGLSDGISALLTLAAGIQGLGFLLLVLKVQYRGGASGISLKMLGMFSATLALRLSATIQYSGYLP